jgi:hypothetical protein
MSRAEFLTTVQYKRLKEKVKRRGSAFSTVMSLTFFCLALDHISCFCLNVNAHRINTISALISIVNTMLINILSPFITNLTVA